jgi:Kef-type K+ transport system membrane component KefB
MKNFPYKLSVLLIISIAAVWILLSTMSYSDLNDPFQKIIQTNPANTGSSFHNIIDRLANAPGVFLLQLIVIMLVARLTGYLFQLIGQPLVVGEIIAGLILGPSVLGALFPQAFLFVFPADSLDVIQTLSQIGLIFFMFIIGMELDIRSVRKSANVAFLISFASIAIPFISGIILAYYLYSDYSLENVRFSSFALFMGTSMSITAFPVLARIVQERKLTRTPIGSMAITVAAIGDVVAWCILAVDVAIAKAGDINHAFLTIGLSVVYLIFMFYLVKPVMYRIGRVYSSREAMAKPIVALIFLLVLSSSLLTEAIGIHALFGAFIAGVIMPDNLNFKRVFTEKIEDISLVIFLPLFFVSTGLRTEIGLINTGQLWMTCLVIICIATTAKFGGTVLASKYAGLTWNHSFVLGTLMNARGLMELIILNIGYDLGILSPEIFTMLILMALVTTFLTGPGLNVIGRLFPGKEIRLFREKTYKILLSFANPKMGETLLKLTHQLISGKSDYTAFTALHISPRTDLSPDEAKVFEKESFTAIRHIAEKNNLALGTIYRNTNEIVGEILQTCKAENPDFLILGSARSVFSTDILGGILKRIINEAFCDVLIFNERNFKAIHSVLIVYFGNGDDHLFKYARMLNHDSGRKFYSYHRGIENQRMSQAYNHSGIPVIPISGSILQLEFLQSVDLVLISENNWKTLESKSNLPLGQFPSLLIIHHIEGSNKLLDTPES